jgi:FSR family fosmidomycin resistance protein-like MFS transporter
VSRPYRSIYTLSFAHLVTDIYMPVITAVLPLLIADRGLSFFSAGLLVTAYNLTSSVTQPLFGWISDYKGRQIHVSTSLLISALFMALIGVVTSLPAPDPLCSLHSGMPVSTRTPSPSSAVHLGTRTGPG